jgi:hypothetical protein
MTPTHKTGPLAEHPLRAPVLWGVVWGLIQAAAPLGFWWLDPAVVYALSLALIAAVYIGFAVADGRPRIVATEASVAGLFVVIAAAAVTGPAWLLVLGFTGHGLKDLWQHRHHYVANTHQRPLGSERPPQPGQAAVAADVEDQVVVLAAAESSVHLRIPAQLRSW